MVDDRHSPFELRRIAQRAGARQVVADSVLWLVYEMPPAAFDRRSRPSLIFESDDTVRRVRTFPAEWRSLADADLFALSWTR